MTETVRNSLKERLARGEVASSMTVRLSRSVEIAQVAATAGFDSLYIDLEHSSALARNHEPDLLRGADLRDRAAGARARRSS